jgi:prevent-host-death family protein
MRVVALGKAKNEFSACVEEANRDRVLVTRHGRPAALIIGVAGESIEDLLTRSDRELWDIIEARRKAARTIPADEMRQRLGVSKKKRAHRRR